MAPLASSSRKRKTSQPEASTSTAKPVVPDDLTLGGDSDGEEHTDDEAQMDDTEEPFPELDLASSDEDDGDFADGEGDDDNEGVDSDDDDEEEGYNSSDIDALDDDEGTSPPPSLTHSRSTGFSRSSRSRSRSPISHFIAENTTKPDERDPSIILRQEDERAGVWTVSQLTGRPKRVYPDIEAGYGSESSTEDVSGLVILVRYVVGGMVSSVTDSQISSSPLAPPFTLGSMV